MTTTQGTEPTQVRRPLRAVLRTALAVGIPAILLLPTVIQMVIEELGPQLPPRVTGWLVVAGLFVTALASLITRLMALPQVELLLRRLPGAAFAAQPEPKPDDQRDAGESTIATAALVIIAAIAAVMFIVWLLDNTGGQR